jgi:nitrilase
MNASRDRLTVAVVQAGSVLFEPDPTLAKAEQLIRGAAARGATLIVAPEAFLGGYPKGMDFGVRIGTRSTAGRKDFHRYWDAAIEVPGSETEFLAALCGELACHLVIGAVERSGSTLYCSALFFGPDRLLGKHRKLAPTAAERVVWGRGDGSTMPAITVGPAVIGAAICWENYLPLFRAAMYDKGVTVWCAPTVDDRDTWLSTMRHIAVEGRCFVLSACQYLRRDDQELIRGGSLIVSPLGDVLAGPIYGEENTLIAELDLGEIPRARFDLDVSGHYARPDVFTLIVNEKAQIGVHSER